MKRTLYIFKDSRLVALHDVTETPIEALDKIIHMQEMLGRGVDLSPDGRAICCVCRLDLGARPGIKSGCLSHGYCQEHFNEAMDEIGI